MALQYKQIFSALAKEYKCCIAAGSMLLPDAIIDASNTIQSKAGSKIYNTFFLFDTTGATIEPLTKEEVNVEHIFAAKANNKLLFVASEKQNISFVVTNSAAHIANADSIKNYSLNKNKQFAKIQQGIALTFNGNLFDKQLNGHLQLIQNDTVLVFPPAIGKGRIVCLWLK